MRPSEQYGIVAKYPGTCGLCGQRFAGGDRIFHLPPARRGASQDPWVCRRCRYPAPDHVPTLQEVLDKIAHRIAIGKGLALNRRDVDQLLDFILAALDEDYHDRKHVLILPATERLQIARATRVAANIRNSDILELLDALTSLGLLQHNDAGNHWRPLDDSVSESSDRDP